MFHLGFAFISFAFMGTAVGAKWLYRDRNFDKLAQLSGLSFLALFATGVGLVIKYHSSLTSACLAGLVYLGALTLLYVVYRQLRQPADK